MVLPKASACLRSCGTIGLKLLQMDFDHLLRPEGDTFPAAQNFHIGIIHRSVEGLTGLGNNLRKKIAFTFSDSQYLMLKESHAGFTRFKGDDHKVRRDNIIGGQCVELIGAVKDNLALSQNEFLTICRYLEFPLST